MRRRFEINAKARAVSNPLQQGLDDIVAAVKAGASIGGEVSGEQWVFCRSSGSTGSPKVIRRAPESWIASFEVNQSLFGLSDQDVVATLGTLEHSLTLYAVLEALHLGMDVLCLHGVGPKTQTAKLARATVLYTTPAQLKRLLTVEQRQIPELRLILSGGGKLDLACRTGLRQLAPNARVVEFFGASESSFVTMSDETTPIGSVGKAYPEVNFQIDGGELWVKSPYLFDGYEGTEGDARWRDGFLNVGEMASTDDAGNLTLLGRVDRMITIADQNVFPEAIEAALLQNEGVSHAAVLPRPDEMRGHRLVAVIEGAAMPGLAKELRERFGSMVAPKEIIEVQEMPLLPAGKPDLRVLAQWLEKR